MKKLLVLFVSVFIGNALFCQSNSKMDFYLATKHQLFNERKADGNQMLPLLIRGNMGGIKQLVQKCGGTFKYSYGSIAAIIIPISALGTFNESGSVLRMEGAPHRISLANDSMRVKNHIQEVLDGLPPLPQAYQGKGVAIGFLDTGIDYLHADFRDSSGTRVKFYWDQNRYPNIYTPTLYGYGQAWNKAQIDASSGIDPNDSASIVDFGHGSNVAGSACGNGSCNGREMGGCPKADIIFVAVNLYSSDPTILTDAVNYIYTCADSLNEPCVINASLGEYDGSHDDSDLQGEIIDSMIAAKQPGRVMVVAAGNAGTPYHVHDSLTGNDTAFTWYVYDGGIGIVDIPIFANETDFNNVKFRLRVDKVQTGSYTERDTLTVYSSISHYMGLDTAYIYNSTGQRLGTVYSYGQVYAKGSYSLEFQIVPDSTSYYWGFQSTGTGKFDAWDLGSIVGVKDSTGFDINPVLYPGIKNYKQPDTLMTICSSFQCSPHIITVQTYFNRLTWVACSPDTTEINTNTADIPESFVWGSSRGPTRNFIHLKPDVAAAGNCTMSTYPTWMSVCNIQTDTLGCHDIDGGTSMASPMVAAAAALYMNAHPSATDSNVWRCLTETAYNDRFTGPASQLPNYNWGYGKLHTFDAITSCGPTSITSVRQCANACAISAYPNPYSINTTVSYEFSSVKNFTRANLIVYDMIGKVVRTIELKNTEGFITLDRKNLAPGMYFYSLVVDGLRLKTEKLEVL